MPDDFTDDLLGYRSDKKYHFLWSIIIISNAYFRSDYWKWRLIRVRRPIKFLKTIKQKLVVHQSSIKTLLSPAILNNYSQGWSTVLSYCLDLPSVDINKGISSNHTLC